MWAATCFRLRRQFVHSALRMFIPVLWKVNLTLTEPIPSGPLLIAANHLSHFDPPLLVSLFDRPPEVVALDDLWRSPAAPLLWLYAPIPVSRAMVDLRAIKAVFKALEGGDRVILFPEGRISVTGALERAREGIGMLALRAGVPVLPVAIWGTERTVDCWRRSRKAEVGIRVGRPLTFPLLPGPAQAQRAKATETIMRALAALLPRTYQGIYPVARTRVFTDAGE